MEKEMKNIDYDKDDNIEFLGEYINGKRKIS